MAGTPFNDFAMLTFLVTIFCTVCIYLLFASFNRWGIRTAWAITVNYFVAAGLGWTLAGGSEAILTSVQSDWIWPLALIGVFFYPLFRLTALCSQELGISVATIATKLSMAIPVLVLALADGIFDIAWGQWLGLGLAFPAVWLSAKAGESEETREQTSTSSAFWWMPVVMFVGSGCIDLVFGWYSTDASLDGPGMQMAFASVPFTLGGVVGLAHQIQLGHGLPSGRDVIGGVLLGVTNFASLYFLLLAFDADLLARAMVVPMLNLSVIVLATAAGAVLLDDKPNQKVRWGVAMAIASIGLMMLFS